MSQYRDHVTIIQLYLLVAILDSYTHAFVCAPCITPSRSLCCCRVLARYRGLLVGCSSYITAGLRISRVWWIVSLTALLLCLAAKFPGRVCSPVLVVGAELDRHMVYKVGPGSSRCTVNDRDTLRNWTVSRRITQAVTHVRCVSRFGASLCFTASSTSRCRGTGYGHRLLPASLPPDMADRFPSSTDRWAKRSLSSFWNTSSVKFMSASMGTVKVLGSVWCSDLNVLPTLRVNSSFCRLHVGRCRCKPAPISSMHLRASLGYSHLSVWGSWREYSQVAGFFKTNKNIRSNLDPNRTVLQSSLAASVLTQ